jgi:hypothetical protein
VRIPFPAARARGCPARATQTQCVTRATARSAAALPAGGKGWHLLVKRCVKAIEAEIAHQLSGKRKTLNLSCCNCLKDIVKRAARQPGALPLPARTCLP